MSERIEIKICCGKHCSTLGGMNLLSNLDEDPYIKKNCELVVVNCNNLCGDGDKSPVVMIGDKVFNNASPEQIQDAIRNLLASQCESNSEPKDQSKQKSDDE